MTSLRNRRGYTEGEEESESNHGHHEAPYGSAYTHEDDDDDDDNDDGDSSDEEEENTENDDDGGLLSYLFDRSSLKQHAFAILVAVIATGISYVHVIAPNHESGNVNTVQRNIPVSIPIPIPTTPIERETPLKATEVHHHHSYTRTSNIAFCAVDFLLPSETNQERIKRVLPIMTTEEKNDEIISTSLDENLVLFEVNFPKEYIDIMNDYYVADEGMDDFYNRTLSDDEEGDEMTENEQFQCLVDGALEQQHRSTVPMHTVAYIRPNIKTYYSNLNTKNPDGSDCSVKAIMEEQRLADKNKDITAATLSYTGFTAKFVNLSTKPMNLFWDGKKKPKFRARLEPFESFATVTTPGNSFYIAPLYDKTHAVERWVMTEDDAFVAYDTLSEDEELLAQLTIEEKKLYEMQKLNMRFAREYLAKTQRMWLSMFPRPMPMHTFHPALYIGQEQVIRSEQSHFLSLPTDRQGMMDIWRPLDYADYDRMLEEKKATTSTSSLNLAKYRGNDGLDLTLKTISITPRVFQIDNFLSDVEVEHLKDMTKKYNISNLETDSSDNANTKTKGNKKKRKKTAATSEAWIRREMSPIVDAIYHRSADLLNIDESLLRHRNEHEHSELATHHSIAEAMHITHFTNGQGYAPISDAAQASLKNRYQPNRFATIMFFLDDIVGVGGTGSGDSVDGSSADKLEPGGDTVFPLAINEKNHDGMRVTPKKGRAILFYNMLPDGNIDDLSQHASEMLNDGEKWVGSIFVWDPIID